MVHVSPFCLKYVLAWSEFQGPLKIVTFLNCPTKMLFFFLAGLKKVTADMQTHKNPNLRTPNAVPSKGTPQPPAPSAGPVSRIGADPNKAPNVELKNGKKWMVVRSLSDNFDSKWLTGTSHKIIIWICRDVGYLEQLLQILANYEQLLRIFVACWFMNRTFKQL